MKSVLKKFIYNVLNYLFEKIFYIMWRINFLDKKSNYMVVDLDNTICNSGSFNNAQLEPNGKNNILSYFLPRGTIENHYKYLNVLSIKEVVNFIDVHGHNDFLVSIKGEEL